MISPRHSVFLLVPLLALATSVHGADPLYDFCGTTGNFTANSTYDANLSDVLASVASASSGAAGQGFYNLSAGQSPDAVNAIALCRGDVGDADCRSCLNDSAAEIARRCPVQKQAIIWYDYCMLRYSNRSIFGTMEGLPAFYMRNANNVTSNVDQFNQVLRTLTDGLRDRAANGNSTRKFAVGNATAPNFKTLFGLVQCTPDLSQLQCVSCLVQAIGQIPRCCNQKEGGRVVTPSCNIRFEVYPFFYSSAYESPPSPPLAPQSPVSPPPPPMNNPSTKGKGTKSGRIALIITIPAVGLSLLIAGILCICLRSRRLKKNFETVPEDEIRTAESLQYDLNTIRAATNDFSDANKLGQGGFGTVYKGTLANGQVIAVKRLSVDLGQGDQQFKNEVLLVARLQHRNLVRLLGFCLEGTERLLMYEFVPNSSLDNFIYDPVKRSQLDWERRQKIIGGIARGLLYLHEDSQLRIIHRDLKASNILLDTEMTPKISDFGTARLFMVDQTQDATSRVVGTYGYMAPEYAMHGLFSVKSDVFSFGVMLLEIISGQKCSRFCIGDTVEDLLSYAWRSWREGTASNLIDPNLTSGSRTEMLRCIHVGLLCVQEIEADRPTMGAVVLMLNSFSTTLPLPSRPAFILHSIPESDTASRSKNRENQESANEASITELYPR
ncbi:cysteine-rich receptor-like protein kinase 44 isoform X1 [Rhodamnia argentea]|uniref:Cysteine-rich receptor-like protein kinase 44 isoform X1 n=1 Tax=Rhodamnia argentea TaxID=178133 RepID=A0ABM3HYM2_9MYRT|nr:cysteine-rich receptor-like protein kinase 44 isoform X1 [Rhodamnia argentea]